MRGVGGPSVSSIISKLSHDAVAINRQIALFAEAAEDDRDDPQAVRRHLAAIRDKTARLDRMIRSARLLAQVSAHRPVSERHNLGELCHLAVRIEPDLEKRFALRIRGTAFARCDPLLVALVLRALFHNALEHAAPGGALTLELLDRGKDGALLELVTPGERHAEAQDFQPFTARGSDGADPTPGLGLFAVARAMSAQGGAAGPIEGADGFAVFLHFAGSGR